MMTGFGGYGNGTSGLNLCRQGVKRMEMGDRIKLRRKKTMMSKKPSFLVDSIK
jgi:hypothetical protein